MKVKKIPMRSCVITKEKLPKQELLRFVKTPEGDVIIDESGKANGRGAYVKKELAVIEKAKLTKVLERVLETTIESSVYDQAINLITEVIAND